MVISARVGNVVRTFQAAPWDIQWLVGKVISIDTVNKKLVVQFVGADTDGLGGDTATTGVDYLDHYVPAIDDKVHALSSELRGILVIGKTGKAIGLEMDPTTPAYGIRTETFCADLAASGTYHPSTGALEIGSVNQGPDAQGVWGIPGLNERMLEIANDVMTVVTRMPLRLTPTITGGPAARLAIIDTHHREVVDTFRTGPLEVGLTTTVDLPMGWIYWLAESHYRIGLSDESDVLPFTFTPDACLDLEFAVV